MMTCGLQQPNQPGHCCSGRLYEVIVSVSEEGVLDLVKGSFDGIVVLEIYFENRRRFGPRETGTDSGPSCLVEGLNDLTTKKAGGSCYEGGLYHVN